ncbi:hypothetical protein ABTE09_19385, partial [Acinetobacter baumannii]
DKARRLGGSVHVEPQDIPEVGRFSIVTDPRKAVFCLFKPASLPDNPPPATPHKPGHVGWHELNAADWEKAFGFYAEMFGWQKAEALDMGDMG